MKTLLAPNAPAEGGASKTKPAEQPEPTVAELQKQLADTQAKLAAAEGKLVKAGVAPEFAEEVRQRVAAGLTSEMAERVTRKNFLNREAHKITDPVKREEEIARVAGM